MTLEDLLSRLTTKDAAALRRVSAERAARLDWKPFQPFREAEAALPDRHALRLDFSGPAPTIGEDLSADDPFRQAVIAAARALLPWKKGPYRLFGENIDAEWRSDFKWTRMAESLPDQRDKLILDIGCNNGYYLFRLLPQKPRFLLGVDPVPRCQHQFHLLQRFAQIPNLAFEPWGWEEAAHLPELFDTVFCMGILYHHFNPIQILKNMRHALKPGGLLVLESIVIPGEDPVCLFPPGRYAQMRNVWFTPTVAAMRAMLERAKFDRIETIALNRHEPAEQRTTAWNPGPSFADFLDPKNREHTIEGHPAPWRAILLARKA